MLITDDDVELLSSYGLRRDRSGVWRYAQWWLTWDRDTFYLARTKSAFGNEAGYVHSPPSPTIAGALAAWELTR